MTNHEALPAALDHWTVADRDECADRIAYSEGPAWVIDTITRRRRRTEDGGAREASQ